MVMKSNTIEVKSFQVERISPEEITFEIAASKGTYIRSIAHDFGKKLVSGATLVELRRTGSGDFSIKDAKSVDEWIQIIREEN